MMSASASDVADRKRVDLVKCDIHEPLRVRHLGAEFAQILIGWYVVSAGQNPVLCILKYGNGKPKQHLKYKTNIYHTHHHRWAVCRVVLPWPLILLKGRRPKYGVQWRWECYRWISWWTMWKRTGWYPSPERPCGRWPSELSPLAGHAAPSGHST